jgi:hypothetical protein
MHSNIAIVERVGTARPTKLRPSMSRFLSQETRKADTLLKYKLERLKTGTLNMYYVDIEAVVVGPVEKWISPKSHESIKKPYLKTLLITSPQLTTYPNNPQPAAQPNFINKVLTFSPQNNPQDQKTRPWGLCPQYPRKGLRPLTPNRFAALWVGYV